MCSKLGRVQWGKSVLYHTSVKGANTTAPSTKAATPVFSACRPAKCRHSSAAHHRSSKGHIQTMLALSGMVPLSGHGATCLLALDTSPSGCTTACCAGCQEDRVVNKTHKPDGFASEQAAPECRRFGPCAGGRACRSTCQAHVELCAKPRTCTINVASQYTS